ncbi:MAG: 50S ribosomal protein L23 [Candidatus Magasanikbacteria bacterium GW2011_GWD2_43_18]|uniref:Large ribosomal subunit protein uL23 n=1 Tax=Candidatus Magasanikbacteria bacterium GW2011_GWE2_42_7 TaxID=1619052 RepID=A0A0G1EBH6_9BACT|nr:MAG: 50S ribosomal protein L23 [Candidatus Magasanikbacteria bacterium GW2011_GWC2_42_27]KKS71953.1 MAG: 50S ribosomal protein L23 [Candidatus Magasanikbacteria bacterium GW2011_GWE2_42_7]KKT04301.1 MAG: 50S ribosomal protein L23 [Candidatus Magasanikbacteria bacterium GW2011_GWD2_43_18]KKT24876.1 MAG: 50S ribosomal protein L23 [Candidatus Magasanikbacteria bacterium GW2011_GWA2_43_9]HBB38355.1 50S ribosomal protein L23 [Candidatus Magasanikbacteria bacterium]
MGILKRKTTDTKAKKETTPVLEEKKRVSVQNAFVHKRILLGAHVSEKAASVESTGRYTFRVAINATKNDISTEIKTHYGIAPLSVRVINVEGKNVRFGRTLGKRKDWKKAIVTLPEGKHIDIHSGV